MDLLGGTEGRMVCGRREEVENEGLERAEVELAIGRLRVGKVAGVDGLGEEVWKYAGEGVRKIWEICNKVWKGEGWPEGWRTGIITPIRKKGKGRRVEDYRGVTVMNTLYKVYAMVIQGRLEKEMEKKNMLPEEQAGFRKGRGVLDNIYVLNYIVNRELMKEGRREAMGFLCGSQGGL